MLTKGLALKTELTAERLRELLHYDPETGVFTRRTGGWRGKAAGNVRPPHGYRYIHVAGRQYRAARLAWLYMTGSWPVKQIDHRDRNRLNDAWQNLRQCTNAENSWNRGKRSDNTSGFVGVTWNKKRRSWQAQIKVNGKNRVLGFSTCPSDGHTLYLRAKREIAAAGLFHS